MLNSYVLNLYRFSFAPMLDDSLTFIWIVRYFL